MGRFLTDLDVKRLPDKDGRKQWKLIAPLIYESKTVGLIVVPTGFITDFASVPRLPLVYWFFGGRGDAEAVLHDWLYKAPHNTGNGLVVDRSMADRVLRGARYSCDRVDLSEYDNVTLCGLLNNLWAYFGAWCFWFGVRIAGWAYWEC